MGSSFMHGTQKIPHTLTTVNLSFAIVLKATESPFKNFPLISGTSVVFTLRLQQQNENTAIRRTETFLIIFLLVFTIVPNVSEIGDGMELIAIIAAYV